MDNIAKCPLCHVELEYKKINNTHVYVCEECPFVGFEFYFDEDMENLKAYLSDEKECEKCGNMVLKKEMFKGERLCEDCYETGVDYI
jgi:ssDNA-binding Zn-finger/Zn-ribbon topoisomerase 1